MAEDVARSKPACDLCHSRKVKCDRQEPCVNCILARKRCLRSRRRTTRSQRERGRDIGTILTDPESSPWLSNRQRPSDRSAPHYSGPDAAEDPTTGGSFSSPVTTDSPHRQHRRNAPLENSEGRRRVRYEQTKSSDTSVLQATSARDVIEQELVCNRTLPNVRLTILQAALSLATEVASSNVAVQETAYSYEVDDSHVPWPPPVEVVYIALRSIHYKSHDVLQILTPNTDESNLEEFYSSDFPDHIPASALERVARALLEHTVTGQKLLQYNVILYYKAVLCISDWASNSQPRFLQQHYIKSRKRFIEAAFAALSGISLLESPSLYLLQALLSGAALMQMIGNVHKCWYLTASASNVLVALGYHKLLKTEPKSNLDKEIHVCVAWCYQFDKSMSMLLLRPPSLPKLQVPAASLIGHESSHMGSCVKMIMEIADSQEAVLQLSIERDHGNETSLLRGIKDICSNMADVGMRIEDRLRSSSASAARDHAYLHWLMLQFMCYSTLTKAIRLSPSIVHDQVLRDECICNARAALQSWKELQKCVIDAQNPAGMYPFYFAWSIASYPLNAFFVVFCNVVCISSLQDFQLLEDVSNQLMHLAGLAGVDPYFIRFEKVLGGFVNLCRPLFRNRSASQQPPSLESTSMNFPTENNAQGDNNAQDLSVLENSFNYPDIPLWDDEIMQQLFEIQPCADWLSTDIIGNAEDSSYPTY